MIRLIALPAITLLLGFVVTSDPPQPKSPAAYPEHLTGAFTGGFGEETCRSCHFDYDLNPDGGRLKVTGLESTIESGEVVKISIEASREEMGKAGFQLTAHFADGRQAGSFRLEKNERVTLTDNVSDSVQYVQHSAEGTEPTEEGINNWSIQWKAPEQVSSPIIFNIAANAGNGDQSEFGDFIYAEEIKIDF
jgi:hypothetical protein